MDYVVQPQTIELPQSGNLNQQPTELRSIACGRAHTVIATDKISMYWLDRCTESLKFFAYISTNSFTVCSQKLVCLKSPAVLGLSKNSKRNEDVHKFFVIDSP